MVSIVGSLFEIIWAIFKWPITILLSFILILIVLVVGWTIYYRLIQKMKRPEGEHYRPVKENIFHKIFVSAPRQFALDRLNRNPEFFAPQGVYLYTGSQGAGKTSTMVHDIMKIQEEYPKCKVITNFAYKNEDDQLMHWKQLVDYNNGIQGMIVGIDELQNWFNSKQSKDFPPEMLQIVTTNRKNRRCIMGTAQQFYMVSKDIRTQCTEIRHCHTFGGVFTIVIRKTPIIDSTGECKEEKFRGMYCWVHSPKVRESYDTYKMIEVLSKTGFKPETDQYRLENRNPDNIINIKIDKKSTKK